MIGGHARGEEPRLGEVDKPSPRLVFVVHDENRAADHLTKKIKSKLLFKFIIISNILIHSEIHLFNDIQLFISSKQFI